MNENTLFIGLGHYSRTGKDSFANEFLRYTEEFYPKLSVKKIPFAWKLKEVCHDLYGWAGVKGPAHYDSPTGEKDRDIPLPALGNLTPVQLWVRLGTPAIRENVYQDTWIDYVLRADHGADIVVIPDVRFPNETLAIRERGGLLWQVVRPGYGPRDTVADQALVAFTGWDEIFGQTGDFQHLLQQARGAAESACNSHTRHWGLKKL